MEMESRKEHILQALDAHVRQRSGMDARNYSDATTYRAEQRRVIRDLHDYRILRSAVVWRDIDAGALLEASRRAYSGRLTITERTDSTVAVDYCTGQYFPTEYRRAACTVLASALWDYTRENMPKGALMHNYETGEAYECYDGLRAGDWLRDCFRREFGPRLARRYFD